MFKVFAKKQFPFVQIVGGFVFGIGLNYALGYYNRKSYFSKIREMNYIENEVKTNKAIENLRINFSSLQSTGKKLKIIVLGSAARVANV